MSDYAYAGGGSRTVTAFFDERDDADEAVADLEAAGIARTSIRVVEGRSGTTTSTTTSGYGTDTYRREHKGFWDSLGDLFLPDEDRYTYAEGLRRGGYLVTVTLSGSDTQYDRVVEILDREGSIDIDERTESWRSEGYASEGYRSEDYSSGASMTGASATGYAGERTAGASGSTGYGAAGSAATSVDRSGMTTGDEEVIALTEERLRVGKREVSGGRVRVRSYQVEEPVSEDVRLREERVTIERRPVDRAVGVGDEAFRDRTIELDETSEEAVVSKDQRVREEVVIGKNVNERTETVRDTVRRTEVEIDDERTGTDRSSMSTTTTRRSDRDSDL